MFTSGNFGNNNFFLKNKKVFAFPHTNKRGDIWLQKKNISIFICGINMFCVVSTHCTIRKGQSYFLQQTERWDCPCSHAPCFYTDRLHLFFFIKELFTAQYKTAIRCVFEAVTRHKMHCQKNPWKIPHWGNIFFFVVLKSFAFSFNAATAPWPPPPTGPFLLPNTFSPKM